MGNNVILMEQLHACFYAVVGSGLFSDSLLFGLFNRGIKAHSTILVVVSSLLPQSERRKGKMGLVRAKRKI